MEAQALLGLGAGHGMAAIGVIADVFWARLFGWTRIG